MKTFEEIVKQEPVYLNQWSEKFGVIADFDDIYMTKAEYEAPKPDFSNEAYWKENKAKMAEAIKRWEPIRILFASYGCANYSGDAWVLFEQDGKFYEVNGSHCSCYGLEGQWESEEVVLAELENRITKGNFGIDDWSDNTFRKELCEFLGINKSLNKSYLHKRGEVTP